MRDTITSYPRQFALISTAFNPADSTAKFRRLKLMSQIPRNLIKDKQQSPAKYEYWTFDASTYALTSALNWNAVVTTVLRLKRKQSAFSRVTRVHWRCWYCNAIPTHHQEHSAANKQQSAIRTSCLVTYCAARHAPRTLRFPSFLHNLESEISRNLIRFN